uniref:Uncharacterized protein n=1 Tax=Cacopsylla melanoneura TaxID=428564 RepID=A0A8D8Z939_9HEMI
MPGYGVTVSRTRTLLTISRGINQYDSGQRTPRQKLFTQAFCSDTGISGSHLFQGWLKEDTVNPIQTMKQTRPIRIPNRRVDTSLLSDPMSPTRKAKNTTKLNA